MKRIRNLVIPLMMVAVIIADISVNKIDTSAIVSQKYDIAYGNKSGSFKTYYNKVLKKRYGVFNRKQTGTMRKWDDSWLRISGVMGAAVQDFDSDEKKEMMVCVAEKLRDGKNSKIVLQMYEKGRNGIKLASELRFTPYYKRKNPGFSGITLSPSQSVETFFGVSFIKREKKRYIVCENNQCQQSFADGSSRDYWLIEYKKNRLSYVSSFTQTDGGSSDFAYTVYDLKSAKRKTKGVYYSENPTFQKGKYRSYSTAIKKYFGKYDIKLNRNARFSVVVSGKSILLKDKRNVQLFTFHNKRVKADWKRGVYKFRATVKALNNL